MIPPETIAKAWLCDWLKLHLAKYERRMRTNEPCNAVSTSGMSQTAHYCLYRSVQFSLGSN